MSDRARHHYVPQMYMRLFSGEATNRIGLYVIESGRFIAAAPVKGQAYRKYFYGADGSAEEAFGKIENRTAPILKSIIAGVLPDPTSYEYEALMFYLGLQHSRTVDAAAQFAESAEKTIKFLLRTTFELEQNQEMLDNLERVEITRTNPVGDTVSAATVGASLLTDLALLLVKNASHVPFIASDAPVVLHNRLYEASVETDAAGYANVGLQLFLPLGPHHLLLCYDRHAYAIDDASEGTVCVTDDGVARLLNDLQWEAADEVLLTAPDMSPDELTAQSGRWRLRRPSERTVFRSEVVPLSEDQHQVRHGVGGVPSTIKLDLPFVRTLLDPPALLGPFDVAAVRSPIKVEKARRAFEYLDTMADALRARRRDQ